IAGLFPIVPAGLATSFALYPAINRWAISDRPCGTYCLLSSRLPAINRWAISDRPCGTRNFVCLVPSDKSLGYFRSSLRDLLSSFFTTPAINRWLFPIVPAGLTVFFLHDSQR